MARSKEELIITLPEESLASQTEQFEVAERLLVKMGIRYQTPEIILPEVLKPDKYIMIGPKDENERIGRLSFFATEGNERPLKYLLESPIILRNIRHLSYIDFIRQILASAGDEGITSQFEYDYEMSQGLKVARISLRPDCYSYFETIGTPGDRAVGLIFFQPQPMMTSLGQSLLEGSVGFLTLP